MYTRCPECATVFQIEIEDLKAAEGTVCCGECDRVFNALVSLTDSPDNGGQRAAPAEPTEMPEQTADGNADDENEPQAGDLFEDLEEAANTDETGPAPWAPDEAPESGADVPSPEQVQWEQKLAELGLVDNETSNDEPAPTDQDESPADEPAEETEQTADWLQVATIERRKWPWALAAGLAGLALAAQTVHYWRDDLAKTAIFESWLGSLYESLGQPLPKHWDVRGYLVEKGAVSDHPDIAGTLLVNAVIGNAASEPLPYPLLKVSLLDRWGEAIGERFFAPAEYLEKPDKAHGLITSGDLIKASVLIVDPGQGAVSYGIDVCLRDVGNRLTCAHQDAF